MEGAYLRRGYRRIEATPEQVPKRTVDLSSFQANLALIFVIVSIALATTVFLLILTRRINDKDTRDRVKVEQATLDEAVKYIQNSVILEQVLKSKKNISGGFVPLYEQLKVNISANMADILAIDNLENITAAINATINATTAVYVEQIEALEKQLAVLKSSSNDPNVTSVELSSGSCTLQGLGGTSVAYAYKRIALGGVDYFYYVFDPTTEIQITSSGFAIEACSPAIFDGLAGDVKPVFRVQTDSFTGNGALSVTGVQAGANKLDFLTETFVGTKNLGIKKLVYLDSFF